MPFSFTRVGLARSLWPVGRPNWSKSLWNASPFTARYLPLLGVKEKERLTEKIVLTKTKAREELLEDEGLEPPVRWQIPDKTKVLVCLV